MLPLVFGDLAHPIRKVERPSGIEGSPLLGKYVVIFMKLSTQPSIDIGFTPCQVPCRLHHSKARNSL